MKVSRNRRAAGLLLAVPVGFVLITFGSALILFLLESLHPSTGMGSSGEGFTLENYGRLLDSYFFEVLVRTALISLVVTALSLVVAYPFALYVARYAGRFGTICLVVVLASHGMSLVVRALGWISILTEGGPANQALLALGLISHPIRLLDGNFALVVGLVHGFVPLFVLILYPVLHAIDPAFERAAEGLGASRMTVIRKIIWPLSLPGVVAASLLCFAICMGVYTTTALLAGGRVTTFPILVQQQISVVMNYPFGAAMAMALLVVVMGMTWAGSACARWYAAIANP
ncbi:MAG TPA: ABC transporter permease [Hyphomicrobiales bacterium]|nr:ABC transporter permease [Hyphomicrobiales bacterium]